MTHFGKIMSYDSVRGRGSITPDRGGNPLAFVKADLQKDAEEPRIGQRYGYETSRVGGGETQAIRLRPEHEQSDTQQG